MIIVSINAVPLFKLLNQQTDTSLLGAVLALLGSPALGFLVTQPWWIWFRNVELWKIIPKEKLSKKYGLKIEDGIKKAEILLIYDYILHSELHTESGMRGLSDYATRRYDNYVLLSSSIFALWIGGIIGILGRFIALCTFPSVSFLQYDNAEIVIWVSILITVLILSFFILEGLRELGYEYTNILSAIIKNSKITRENLETTFKDWKEDVFNEETTITTKK